MKEEKSRQSTFDVKGKNTRHFKRQGKKNSRKALISLGYSKLPYIFSDYPERILHDYTMIIQKGFPLLYILLRWSYS